MSTTSKSVRNVLTKGGKAAYGEGFRLQHWQETAIVEAATRWDEKLVRLFDHPRGSGKTREIVMMSHVALRCLGVRLALLITDRRDLDAQIYEEARHFFEKTHKEVSVMSCGSGKELTAAIQELEDNPRAKKVITVTLQSFPHVEVEMSETLRKSTAALADEAHRSHADKSLSEELNRVLGGPVHFLLYTGTASDRCLRLFGEVAKRGGAGDEGEAIHVCKPFHAVSEAEVAKRGMIFELGKLQRKVFELTADMRDVGAAATQLGLGRDAVESLKSKVASSRVSEVVLMKTTCFLEEFKALRQKTPAFKPQMMIVASSRRAVMDYVEACRACLPSDETGSPFRIYGAFSGKLAAAAVGEDGDGNPEYDEAEYNKDFIETLGSPKDPHRFADILVVCDRFETGYDNDKVCLVAVDKKMSSLEKLVQVYSRGNRRRDGKEFSVVIDLQNQPKDIERAVLEYSVPRECLASEDGESFKALSDKLRALLGDLATAPSSRLEEGLQAWTPENRNKLGDLLGPYIRRRKEGVNRAMVSDLVPLKQAEVVWKTLFDHHHVDLSALWQKQRAIADRVAARSCTLSMLAISDMPFPETGAPDALATPRKRRGGDIEELRLDALEIESPPKESQSEHIWDRLLAEVPAGVAPAGAPPGAVQSIAEDIKALGRIKKRCQRKNFQRLQRVVLLARNPEQHGTLVDLGADHALVGRILHGERVDRSWAHAGLHFLAPASARARRVDSAAQYIRALQDATVLGQAEADAATRLVSLVREVVFAKTRADSLEAEIEASKTKLNNLKNSKNSLANFQRDDSSDDDVFGFRNPFIHFRVRREQAALRKKLARQAFSAAQNVRKLEVEACAERIANLEKSQKVAAFSSDDLAVFEALGLAGALQQCAAICRGRFRLRTKASLMTIWEELARHDSSWRELAAVSSILRALDQAKRARMKLATQQKRETLEEALKKLQRLHAQGQAMAIQLGAVEDLLVIAPAQQELCGLAIDGLRAFAATQAKAREAVEFYDRVVKEEASAGYVQADAAYAKFQHYATAPKRTRTLLALPAPPA